MSTSRRINTVGALATTLLAVVAASIVAVFYFAETGTRLPLNWPVTQQATRAPLLVERDTVFEFAPFRKSEWNMSLAVPRGATKVEHTDSVSFSYSNEATLVGSFVIDVQRSQTPAAVGFAAEALEARSRGLASVSNVETVTADGGRIAGALRTYASGSTTKCLETRSVLAVFLDGPFTYTLTISSDATNRCDARALPETAGVIDSLRLGQRP